MCQATSKGRKEEKMGVALIKAKRRVSSAVISQLGATANQWTVSTAIIINSSGSEKLEGNKKEWERLYQEAHTTCAEQQKAGEMETNRQREQDCGSMVQMLEDLLLLIYSWCFCHHDQSRQFLISIQMVQTELMTLKIYGIFLNTTESNWNMRWVPIVHRWGMSEVFHQTRFILLSPISSIRAFLSTWTGPLVQQAWGALDQILTQTSAHQRNVSLALAFQMFFKANVNATIFVL